AEICGAAKVEIVCDDCVVCRAFGRGAQRPLASTNTLDIPIHRNGKPVGRMILDPGRRAFDPVDVEAAEILASQAAICLHTARLYERLGQAALELDEQP
ncbi:MAG: hypothetical protein NZ534_11715, partial [Bacteroidia bacterium]|nr:hypothetical protein [Bacteroidia bacterium]